MADVDRIGTADEFEARAVEETGCNDFGPGGWRDGLDALLASAHEADLSEFGAALFRSWISDRLRRRLLIVDWAARHPVECCAPIERPLIVTGLGRSGTTFSLELLAADRSNRTLMLWEGDDPIPPPEAATFWSDPRIATSIEATERMYDTVPALRAVHYEPGDGPTECRALLGLAFRACDFPGLFTLPSYMRWWLTTDQRPAYDMHRLGLGVLQSRAPGPWALKDPWHLLGLDALLDVYPDARVVVLHRDPREVVPSLAGLSVATGADFMRNAPIDPTFWGSQNLEALSVAADRLVDTRRERPPEQFLDVSYRALVQEPIATIAAIYEFAGRDWTANAETAVREHVARRPKNKYGVHQYTLEQFGLTPTAIDGRFARYTDAFALPLTPR